MDIKWEDVDGSSPSPYNSSSLSDPPFASAALYLRLDESIDRHQRFVSREMLIPVLKSGDRKGHVSLRVPVKIHSQTDSSPT